MLNKVKGFHVFSKLSLIIILFVAAIILASSIVSGKISSNVIKAEKYASSIAFLSKLSGVVENEIKQINGRIVAFYFAELDVDNISNDLNDMYQRYTVYSKINNLIKSNPFIDSAYIYFEQGTKVYYQSSQAAGVMEANRFFDYQRYEAFLNSGQTFDITEARALNPVYTKETIADARPTEVRAVSFINKLSFGGYDSMNTLIVNIREDYFLRLISGNYLPYRNMILTIDEAGRVLMSYDGSDSIALSLDSPDITVLVERVKETNSRQFSMNQNIAGIDSYVTGYKNDLSGRSYVLVIPETEIFKPIKTVNHVLFLFSAIFIIVSMIFSALVDRKFFQPVLGILHLLKSKGAEKEAPEANEFKQIQGYIDDILSKNMSQEKQMQNYFSFYKDRNLLYLLKGEKEALQMLEDESLNFNRKFNWFNVVLVSLLPRDGGSDMDNRSRDSEPYKAELHELILQLGQTDRIQINPNIIAFLLCSENKIESSRVAGILQDWLGETTIEGFTIHIGIGIPVESMKNIKETFEGTEKLIQCHQKDANHSVYEVSVMEHMPLVAYTYPDNINNKELVEKVISFIHDHYMEDIGLETIADYVYFSKSHMSKVFKEISGYTFTDYLIKVRMEISADLLINKNVNIITIINNVGYTNIQSFNRVFKNYYKCTPSEFRRRQVM